MAAHVVARVEPEKYLGLEVFEPLADEQARRAIERAQARAVPRGQAVYRQDQEADSLHVLAEGRMKLSRVTADGRQLVVKVLRPGEVFGSAAISTGIHSEFAIPLVQSTVLSWSADAVQDLIAEMPALAMSLLVGVGRHLAEAHERMGELATAKAEQRVALALTRLAGVAGEPTDGGVRIELAVSREDVAQMAGTTLYTVSRLMSGWERAGFLRLGRQRVVILDWDQLERHARG